MPETWIDLTDLAQWRGHMTGIQRVVFNVARHYARNDGARFFVYAPGRAFEEVDFAAIAGRFEGIPAPSAPTHESRLIGHARRAAARGRELAFAGARAAYLRSPGRVREAARRLYAAVPSRSPEDVDALPHPFRPGDAVVLLGSTWYHPSLIPNLFRVRDAGVRIVHLVYDLTPFLYPHFFGPGFGREYARHLVNVLQLADGLLAISENTRRDLQRFQADMGLPTVPVRLLRLGDNPSESAEALDPRRRIRAGEFVLAVGTLEVRKNYRLLYDTWRLAVDRGVDLPQLVIVGGTGWLSGDALYLLQNDPLVSPRVQVISDATDGEVAWLYQNAVLTVYPSWYEGWGLPIAESLNYGKLCLASGTSSMPEIGGDLVRYFDPHDAGGLLELVRGLLSDPEALADAERRIRSRYARVDWSTTYEQCDDAVRAVLRTEP